MNIMLKYLYLLGMCVFLLTSCDPYQKVVKSDDYELKYEKVKEYYNEGEYHKAIPLLEELMVVWKGKQNIEKLYYFHAYSYYGQMDYLLAAFYFQNFIEYYPNSYLAEDALFMIPYCHTKMSPKASLEQTYSYKAIEGFQIFANSYPKSEKIPEVNALIDEMRGKIEDKDFQNSELYYNTRNYKAAVRSFENFLKDYPYSEYRETVKLMILKSYYDMARNSVESKKQERYNLAIDAYNDFISSYAESKFAREASNIVANAKDNLEKLENNSDDE